jgi:hypothetical protein
MGDAGKQIEATGAPRAQLNRSIPEKDRMSREELIRDRRFQVVDREKGIVMASAPYKMRNEVRKEGDRRVNPIGVPTGK